MSWSMLMRLTGLDESEWYGSDGQDSEESSEEEDDDEHSSSNEEESAESSDERGDDARGGARGGGGGGVDRALGGTNIDDTKKKKKKKKSHQKQREASGASASTGKGKGKGKGKGSRGGDVKSNIVVVTQQDCSYNPVPWSKRQKRTSANTVDVLSARSQGFNTRQSMRPVLGGSYIPNRICRPLGISSQKMFCGRFSTSGDVLLTASQEAIIKLYDSQSVYQWSAKKTDSMADFVEDVADVESHMYRRSYHHNVRRSTTNESAWQGAPKSMKTIHCIDTGWSVISTDFSPDEKWLAYSSWCPYVHLCNTRGEYELHEALDFRPKTRQQFCLFSIQFSPNNTHILGGASDKHIYLYSLERKERVARIKAHLEDVNAVAFADQGSQVVLSGGDDCVIKIWDLRSPTAAVGGLCGHQMGVTCITAKGDGHHFISNGKDQTMKLWDIRKMLDPNDPKIIKASRVRQRDYRAPAHMVFLPKKSKRAADASVKTFVGHKVLQTLIRCYFSPMHTTAQRFVMSGSSDGRVCIWDILTGEMVQSLEWHRTITRDVSWHPYLPLIASFSWDASVGLWGYNAAPLELTGCA